MPFQKELPIDRAIVQTLYDLHELEGCLHKDTKGPELVACTLPNFMWYTNGKSAVGFLPCYEGTYESHLDRCKELAESCDESQKWAIRGIFHDVVRMRNEIAETLRDGKRQASAFEFEFDKDNEYGRMLLVFKVAFGLTDASLTYNPHGCDPCDR